MKIIKIGIAGLGTVGRGLYEILTKNSFLANCKIEIVAVANRSKKDFIDPSIKFYFDITELARDENVEMVIELTGDIKVARNLIELAAKNNKKIITANKALIAEGGMEFLNSIKDAVFGFEAAVAGAIPIIKLYQETYVASEIREFYGILNGTCNFILTKMEKDKVSFEVALKEAQELGYAEADPTFDVGGFDTGHKLAILSAIASNSEINYKDCYIEGIENITSEDILNASEFGYKIKLLAIFKNQEKQQTVYPCFVPNHSAIANVSDSFNAIFTKASNNGDGFIVGRGAGSLPTASAVIANIIDIVNDRKLSFYSNNNIQKTNITKISDRVGKYYINLKLELDFDKDKVLDGFKIEKSIIRQNTDDIELAIIVSEIKEDDIIKLLNDNIYIKEKKFIRIEELN